MPQHRTEKVPLWRYARMFRKDILSAQPLHLYRAQMAAFKTPFFRSFLLNDTALVHEVLRKRPMDFPKSARVNAGLSTLLGASVFVTNGELWERQRRVIDPAFAAARLDRVVPHMLAASEAMVARLAAHEGAAFDIEPLCSLAAADVIFRTLFSIDIDDATAREIYDAFQAYQGAQPLLTARAFFPRWPFRARASVRYHAGRVRRLVTQLVEARLVAIEEGRAPDDLATALLTAKDPVTGAQFDRDEMVDQVAIFLLAGHETSAAALAWALWLVTYNPKWAARLYEEADELGQQSPINWKKARRITAHFKETLRLYPPVPMMVREPVQDEEFRKRNVPKGAQLVISPWHLHRHEKLWKNPHGFNPRRWLSGADKHAQRHGYMPFSTGQRVCPGASFAMAEGVIFLAAILRRFKITGDDARVPAPQAFLTVRSKNGIDLSFEDRLRGG